jgi:flagellar basal-body rod protein FlgC
MSDILSIAVSGLNASAARIANAASNIVNASSESQYPTDTSAYAGYVPQDIVSTTVNTGSGQSLGVSVQSLPRNPAYNPAFDPTSPLANSNGIVAVPNIDIATELVSTIPASTTYDASAKVIEVTHKLDQALLDITT